MIIFVTGATGVLGQPVIRLLRAAGHDVKALCRSDANRQTLEALGAFPVEADLFDVGSVAGAIQGCDAILHLATKIPPFAKMKQPGIWEEDDRLRRDAMQTLVTAAMETDRVKTIVYPGISFFYADGGDDWTDATTARTNAISLMQSTLDAEAQIERFAESAKDRRGVVLRFGAFYGPTSDDSRQVLAMARNGFVMPIGPASAYRSSIWINDAATAIEAALDRCPSGVFDVVEDEPFTQSESAAALAAAVGRRRLWPLPRWLLRFALPADLRNIAARSQRISNARFREITGWAPSVPDQKTGWTKMALEQQ